MLGALIYIDSCRIEVLLFSPTSYNIYNINMMMIGIATAIIIIIDASNCFSSFVNVIIKRVM